VEFLESFLSDALTFLLFEFLADDLVEIVCLLLTCSFVADLVLISFILDGNAFKISTLGLPLFLLISGLLSVDFFSIMFVLVI